MAKMLVIHGPNLNMLGQREKQHYGITTLTQINDQLLQTANQFGHDLTAIQSNAEHALIDSIQQASLNQTADLLILNAGGYTHTSIALRDAVLASHLPMIEVHLSNTAAREPFRHQSLLSDIAIGTIQGFGALSYTLAVSAAHHYLSTHCKQKDTIDGHP